MDLNSIENSLVIVSHYRSDIENYFFNFSSILEHSIFFSNYKSIFYNYKIYLCAVSRVLDNRQTYMGSPRIYSTLLIYDF